MTTRLMLPYMYHRSKACYPNLCNLNIRDLSSSACCHFPSHSLPSSCYLESALPTLRKQTGQKIKAQSTDPNYTVALARQSNDPLLRPHTLIIIVLKISHIISQAPKPIVYMLAAMLWGGLDSLPWAAVSLSLPLSHQLSISVRMSLPVFAAFFFGATRLIPSLASPPFLPLLPLLPSDTCSVVVILQTCQTPTCQPKPPFSPSCLIEISWKDNVA